MQSLAVPFQPASLPYPPPSAPPPPPPALEYALLAAVMHSRNISRPNGTDPVTCMHHWASPLSSNQLESTAMISLVP